MAALTQIVEIEAEALSSIWERQAGDFCTFSFC
jgi:hypothetical protein